jgi:hypothetical protein
MKVKALRRLIEAGVIREVGDEFAVSPERARQLGDIVTAVEAVRESREREYQTTALSAPVEDRQMNPKGAKRRSRRKGA